MTTPLDRARAAVRELPYAPEIDDLRILLRAIENQIREAVDREREACAQTAEDADPPETCACPSPGDDVRPLCDEAASLRSAIADAIRARGPL